MTLSEQTISAIARALLNDRKALAKSLAFWNVTSSRQQFAGQHVESITRDLKENACALVELADGPAPWLKQRADWQTIINNEASTIPKERA